MLSGVTGETGTTTCNWGFGLADGSLAGQKTYTCVGSTPGFSVWSPEHRSCICKFSLTRFMAIPKLAVPSGVLTTEACYCILYH
jgi:hypothetical protein